MPDSSAHSRAFAVLACCARREFAQPRTKNAAVSASEIRALAADGLDWALVPKLARQHGITPLVYQQLQAACADVPQPVLAYLSEQFDCSGQRNLRYTRAMLELLRLLERYRVHTLAFKGPVLAAQAYRNPSIRYFSDLDLLIRQGDLAQVTHLLATQGYTIEPALRGAQPLPVARYLGECHFVHPAKPAVDLHWRLLPGAVSSGVDTSRLWDRVESVSLGGRPVFTLSREDLLLYLCIHGAKHIWKRLGWVCDIAGLAAARPPIHWAHVLERAGEHGCRRMLFLGLALARELAGAEFPAEVSRAMQCDASLEALLPRVLRWLASGAADLPLGKRIRFQLEVTERPRDKAAFLLRRVLVPTIADLKLLPWANTPRSFFYAVRPLRLLGAPFLRRS